MTNVYQKVLETECLIEICHPKLFLAIIDPRSSILRVFLIAPYLVWLKSTNLAYRWILDMTI